MLPVGVFRDAPLRVVADIATLINLARGAAAWRARMPNMSRALRRELPADCEIWTAVSVGREPLTSRGGDRLLFDNGDGGSGRTFDWALVARHPDAAEAMVAGGIGAAQCRARRAGSAPMRSTSARRVDAAARAQVAGEDRRAVRRASPGGTRAAARMRLNGRFGRFGGGYVPEILVPALEQLEAAFLDAQDDPAFAAELNGLLANYAGRPTPLTRCRNLPGNIYLKREDLLHGGAHKTNQVLGAGAARQADGQDPPDRRDRRRPAWRRHGDRRRAARLRDRRSTWAPKTSSGRSSTSSEWS